MSEPIFTPVETEEQQKRFNILPDSAKFPNFIPPSYGTPFSAALDVFAQTDLIITRETRLIDLGFKAEFPENFACLLMPRSGFGSKFGLALANTIGLIDCDYRGTWMAAAWLNGGGTKVDEVSHKEWNGAEIQLPDGTKTSDQEIVKRSELKIKRGEAIGQLLFVKTDRLLPNIVSELSETVRGEGGFGSTDKIRK